MAHVVDVEVGRLQLSPADTTAVLRALDFDGTIYEGTDAVTVR